VLAIGGITELHLERVAAAGADGVAAIGLFIAPGASLGRADAASCRAIPLVGHVERFRATFDRVRRGT
jgi:thiamine monophosphate synthase